jgi:hypothetical protein
LLFVLYGLKLALALREIYNFVLCGCETSLASGEEWWCCNSVLRRMFGPKKERTVGGRKYQGTS